MKKTLLITLVLSLCFSIVHAYTYLPKLTSYDKNEYQAGRQNWDIDIDDNGIVYFANTDGLLYNVYGEWVLKAVKDSKTVRSVLVDKDTIWCGGNSYGYFLKDESGHLKYMHLKDIEGGLIWNIERYQNAIYFQTENVLLKYDKASGTVSQQYYTEGIWGFIEWNGKLWMVQRHGNIGYLDGFDFHSQMHVPAFKENEVRRLFVHNEMLFFVMFDGRVFYYDGKEVKQKKLPTELDDGTLFTGTSYDDKSYCLGTISSGFVQLDNKENVINHVNSSHGLIDNTVLSMKLDHLGNVWLGLDYGIAKVELQNPINTVFKDGATYFISDIDNSSYLATNKGLFQSKDDKPFTLINKTGGQVWRNRIINNQLYAYHNNGLFIINGNESELIYSESGVMDIAHFEGTDYYLFSAYVGVLLMKKTGDSFSFVENLDVWWNPQLVYDPINDCIWADANNSTVIKLSLNAENKVNKESHPEMTAFFKTKIGLIFYNNSDFFTYKNNSFSPYDNDLLKQLKGEGVKALDINEGNNMLVCIQNKSVKLSVYLPDGNIYSYDKLFSALGNNLVENHEFIDISGTLVRVATDRGVIVFDMNHKSTFKTSTPPVISSLTILNEPQEKLFFPFNNNSIELSTGNKDLKFHFGIETASSDVVEYRYRLSPLEEGWSEWKANINEQMYTQVKGGNYRFHLQSRINGGIVEENSLAIAIERMWYQTSWIIVPIILFLLFWMFGIIYIMSRINRNKLKKQHSKFKQKDAEKTVTMKNEQLLQYTEIISHKNEFLNQVKAGLEKMRNSEAQLWVKKITNEVSNEKKEFLFHKLFSEIHQDFIARITEKYPSLTSNDIRLLSFIRINLDSREVANLMNISNKSVDTNRYRLRKKLELAHETDLNQFVRDF